MNRDPGFFTYSKADVENSQVLMSSNFVAGLIEKGYLIVPGPPRLVNLVGLRTHFSRHFNEMDTFWYKEKAFANRESLFLGHVAVLLQVTPDSVGESWIDGISYLKYRTEKPPSALELVYASLVYRLVRRQALAKSFLMRTSTRTSTLDGEEAHACVLNTPKGVLLASIRDDVRDKRTGVASMRVMTIQ
jgi:hypothetical protein